MTNKEKEALRNEIAVKNIMTKKIGKWFKYSMFLFVAGILISIWGFTGMQDRWLPVGQSARDIIKWIAVVLAVLSGIFSAMTFMSFRNSKKHVLKLIDRLQNGK